MAEGTVLEFTADLKELSRALNITVQQGARLTTLKVHNGLIEKTPVDTGRARGSWGISVDTPGTYELPEGQFGAEGGAALARMEQRNLEQVTEENPFREIWISNLLPYIERLNMGSSKQAPAQFVELTIAEVAAEIDAQLEAIAEANLRE
jgi:hypothetical protein